MASHKFKIGEIVTIRPALSRNVPGGLRADGVIRSERLSHMRLGHPWRLNLRQRADSASVTRRAPELSMRLPGHRGERDDKRLHGVRRI